MVTTSSFRTSRRRVLLALAPALLALALVPGATSHAAGQTASGTWTMTGSMNSTRTYFTATLLGNGTVLVQGGCIGCTTGEIYHPSIGSVDAHRQHDDSNPRWEHGNTPSRWDRSRRRGLQLHQR